MSKPSMAVRIGLGVLSILMVGCAGSRRSDPVVDPMAGYALPDPGDFRTLEWTQGFEAAHAKLAREYAFTDWKGVDWAALHDRFLPRIRQAQAGNDAKAYYLALHEYTCSIPDGHVSLTATEPSAVIAATRERVGGSYGLALAELDDWRVVVAAVDPAGPAALAGMVPGTEILAWAGQPPRGAIGTVNVAATPYRSLTGGYSPYAENGKATTVLLRLEQARLLARAPVGSSVEVRFRNPDAASPGTAVLSATADDGRSFSLLDFSARPDFSDRVDSRILPEGFGYLHLRAEVDLQDMSVYPAKVYQAIKEAITAFLAAGTPGMILDLRGNYGGSDELAADLCGFFYGAPCPYEGLEIYDKRDGTFPRVGDIAITPQSPRFAGPVVVLVNACTVSSGEGPPAFLPRLPNVRLIGFHGSNGSFGVAGGEIVLPGLYVLKYPYGRSVDARGLVQLDSRNGVGGSAPYPRVPKTLENVLALAAGTDVELQYAVRDLQERTRPAGP